MTPDSAITVIIPTSPIAIHPSTEIIVETFVQLRKHLPNTDAVILVDGVHPEETYLSERYSEYKNSLAIKFDDASIRLRFHNEWLHQSGMLKKLLEEDAISTPLVFWSECDIPLRDEPIDWQGIVDTLLEGEIGGIRFELTGDPPKRNEVVGSIVTHGIPLVLSTQYVNWPQVFRLDYLKEFLEPFGNSKTYLECAEFDGRVGQLWKKWQYGIYSPEGEIRRCYHTNGRCRGFGDPGKPYIVIDGKQRNIYNTPYKPLF
jgi:hypothetical protein